MLYSWLEKANWRERKTKKDYNTEGMKVNVKKKSENIQKEKITKQTVLQEKY